ncbi:flagellar hook-basal body complex protein FliE [Marinobacteraceae bacterium S3BR75-40.1]
MVDRADINSVLSNMRNLRAQMLQNQQMEKARELDQVKRPQEINRTEKTQETPGFGDMLNQAVNTVNDLQQSSGDLQTRYTQGDPNVDLARVMVAKQKASVAFEGLTQVRNKVIQAYEDIVNMPI